MLKSVWFWVFVGSLTALGVVALRGRHGGKIVSAMAANFAIAGVLLYVLGLAEPYTHLHVPVNVVTLAIVAALGLPGLALLAGLKALVVV